MVCRIYHRQTKREIRRSKYNSANIISSANSQTAAYLESLSQQLTDQERLVAARQEGARRKAEAWNVEKSTSIFQWLSI